MARQQEVEMLSLILLALAAPPADPASGHAARSFPPARHCSPTGVTYAGRGKVATAPQKLGDQPPARHYLAVVRHVGGCPEPAVVRSGIGGR
jgi:hypothetical protein